MINRKRIEALSGIAKEVMEARGFIDTEIIHDKDKIHLDGKRGETAFWVDIDFNGEFFFDLGKEGFSTGMHFGD